MTLQKVIPVVLIVAALSALSLGYRHQDEKQEPPRIPPSKDQEPDFFMSRVINNEYNSTGQRESLFYADRANYYLDSEDVLLIRPRITAKHTNGDTFVARSDTASVINTKKVELNGNVRLIRSTPLIARETVLSMPYAQIDMEQKLAHTDAPTQIQSSYGVTTSIGAKYWYEAHKVELSSNVEGLYKSPQKIINQETQQ